MSSQRLRQSKSSIGDRGPGVRDTEGGASARHTLSREGPAERGEMDAHANQHANRGFATGLLHLLAFLPIFLLLLIIGIVKVALIAPILFVTVMIGNTALILGLYPVHAIWTCVCIGRTKKFGSLLKTLILLLMPVPILLWPFASIIGTILTGLVFGISLPLMETFQAVREGVEDKLIKLFTAGTWTVIKGGFNIVRDFKDICFHSYFSVMDGLVEYRGETIMNMRISQVPGCLLAGIVGVLVDVPMLSLIVLYKVPVMLFKGWWQLLRDLIGRSGPFLETACVPFAGLSILLWPLAVELTAIAGILSSLSLGCYAAAIVYQENSTMSGLLYVISVISMFDEFTNDFLNMREGSCFPRPQYRKTPVSRSPVLPIKKALADSDSFPLKRPLVKTPSMKMQELKAVQIWENFMKSYESVGKELVQAGAIHLSDLEEWKFSKNKIVNIGLPSYVFLQCCIRSIRTGSSGFVMRDNVELTSVNRPEGKIFDWFFEPMLIVKEQIRALNLEPSEEAYLHKLVLYCGDVRRMNSWQNGGVAPIEPIKRAQLEGISRRLQGFSLTITRLPTFRRRFEEVVKALLREAEQLERNVNVSEQAL